MANFLLFFFKQKTAYEIVSGDWSSDVCSSDLARERHAAKNREAVTQQLESLLRSATKAAPERFVIRNGQRYEFVPADTVDWVESANNYVQLHCGPKTHLMRDRKSVV